MTDALTPEKIEELLPCPFCGGSAQTEHFEGNLGRWRWSVGCNDHKQEAEDGGEPVRECYGFQSMTSFATKAEAIAAWNRRASSTLTAEAEVERLRAALRPFAKAASDYERQGEFFSNNIELVLRVSVFAAPEYHNSTAVQVGDLRRARSELEAGHE